VYLYVCIYLRVCSSLDVHHQHTQAHMDTEEKKDLKKSVCECVDRLCICVSFTTHSKDQVVVVATRRTLSPNTIKLNNPKYALVWKIYGAAPTQRKASAKAFIDVCLHIRPILCLCAYARVSKYAYVLICMHNFSCLPAHPPNLVDILRYIFLDAACSLLAYPLACPHFLCIPHSSSFHLSLPRPLACVKHTCRRDVCSLNGALDRTHQEGKREEIRFSSPFSLHLFARVRAAVHTDIIQRSRKKDKYKKRIRACEHRDEKIICEAKNVMGNTTRTSSQAL